MVDHLVWWVSNPLTFGVTLWAVGVGTGWIIGSRTASTVKLESELLKARSDLQSVLRTFEIKKVDP